VIVALAVADSLIPPRIEEGHKVFLPGAPGVLERELLADVYRRLAVTRRRLISLLEPVSHHAGVHGLHAQHRRRLD
jgi:hypothetical protein